MDNRLDILRNSVRNLYTPELRTKMEEDGGKFELEFHNDNSIFEDLEIIIRNWRRIVGHSHYIYRYRHALKGPNFEEYKLLLDRLNVSSLSKINLEHIIMSSDLDQFEKEYLKLKYFI